MGQRALLEKCARVAGDRGHLAVRLDGRDIDQFSAAFPRILVEAMMLEKGASPLDTLLREASLPQLAFAF